MIRVLLIFGTRPEAIKLIPVARELRSCPDQFHATLCATAQHRTLLDQALSAFSVKPEYDLDLMRPGLSLLQSTSRILAGLEPVLKTESPHIVLVQGDTTTTLCGALAAFYLGIPVGHVEAGLRSGDVRQPFPEEMNRATVTKLAALHFAPTREAATGLRSELVASTCIAVTGNTGIDALLEVVRKLEQGHVVPPRRVSIAQGKRLIVVTTHRRESWGEGTEAICRALLQLATRDDVQIVFPVHPAVDVHTTVQRHLSGRRNITLVEPLDYISFVDLMRRAHLLLTDSGGIQEEAPSLGIPVLVMREKTERLEGVRVGSSRLVGVSTERIVEETSRLLNNPAAYQSMTQVPNPYGDGRASKRIAAVILRYFDPGGDGFPAARGGEAVLQSVIN